MHKAYSTNCILLCSLKKPKRFKIKYKVVEENIKALLQKYLTKLIFVFDAQNVKKRLNFIFVVFNLNRIHRHTFY